MQCQGRNCIRWKFSPALYNQCINSRIIMLFTNLCLIRPLMFTTCICIVSIYKPTVHHSKFHNHNQGTPDYHITYYMQTRHHPPTKGSAPLYQTSGPQTILYEDTRGETVVLRLQVSPASRSQTLQPKWSLMKPCWCKRNW